LVGRRFKPIQEIRIRPGSRVDLALDEDSKGLVILKRLVGTDLNPGPRMALGTESAALGLLDHPCIPKIAECSLGGAEPYVAIRYLHGGKFSKLFNSHRRELLESLIHICGILSYVHSMGIVHRDVKPTNVLSGEAGERPKLLDFGLAKVPGRLDSAERRVVGTLDFMAPEQTYAGAKIDHRADIYSLGMLSYIYLSGHYPYPYQAGRNDRETRIEAHRSCEPIPLCARDPAIPAILSHAINRALSKDPMKRFQSADEMAEALSDSLKEIIRKS
jgi:serine/threonine-protein kinase